VKIAIIGGGGVRTPLLVRGLTGSDLPIDTIALYDIDQQRLERIGALAGRVSTAARVVVCRDVSDAIDGADFVFTSIRGGGTAARASDEAAALMLGLVGQETVGAAGFAMAMRNIPPLVAYASEITRRAPRAWIVNFTNPVGIVTEAVQKSTGARIIGICDTPTELFQDAASVLGLESAECSFEYVGLNHLGWLREVFHRGQPHLHRLWDNADALARVYRRPLFDPAFLSQLRLLPTEYLYFYYRPADAIANLRKSGTTRGQLIEDLTGRFFATLERDQSDSVREYDRYLRARDESYMQIETTTNHARLNASRSGIPSDLAGYDKIALAVVRAIHFDQSRVIPLNVRNGGAIVDLNDDDVVEVPCTVNAGGARPLGSQRAPSAVRELLLAVKAYERLTVDAALEPTESAARRALASNPLVGSGAVAGKLLESLNWEV